MFLNAFFHALIRFIIQENEEGEEVEEENLDDELKALLEESSSDLPQDLLDGKHRIR